MVRTKVRCILSRSRFDAAIFDLDGVITQSAKIHAKAWKEMFDFFLLEYGKTAGTHFKPFNIRKDYPAYVDGKPRNEGVKGFLQSRGIELPFGSSDDLADQETICALSNRKNVLFNNFLKEVKIDVYSTSLSLVKKLKQTGFKLAVVSSSKNCSSILENAGIYGIFDVQVDGIVAEQLRLKGKPSPDIFIYAANKLAIEPQKTVIFEDALVGVQAGSQGNFGCVIGVDRAHIAYELLQQGADFVVADLGEIEVKET